MIRQALAGNALVEAVLLLRPRSLAVGARLEPGARGFQPPFAQRRLVPHAQQPHHLDAGQVGVSLVRGVGPRVPHARAVDGGRRVRQGAARADAARGVPAPERPDPRLRVELRRRQPAGARLGDAVRLQRGPRQRTGVATSISCERSFQKLLFNFTWWVNRKDPTGRNVFDGRLPRPRQHRRLRPQRAAADRRPPRAGRRHGVDGASTARTCSRSPSSSPAKTRTSRTSRTSSSSISCGSRTRWTASGDHKDEMWDEADGFYLRRAQAAGRERRAPQGALDGGTAAALRRNSLPRGRGAALPEADGPHGGIPQAQPRPAAAAGGAGQSDRPDARCSRCSTRRSCGACCHACWTSANSSGPAASVRCRVITSTIPTCCTSASTSTRCATCPPSPTAACSAAIRTGAARCGCR